MNRVATLITALLISISFYGQGDVEILLQEKNSKTDTSKITNLSDKLSLWVYGISKFNSLELKNPNGPEKLLIDPNGKTNFGFGFNYKWMGLGIAFGLPPSSKDQYKFGKTQKFDFQLNIFARSFGGDFHIQRYKGYYLSNPKDLINWEEDYFPQLGNLETISIGFSGYYFFNSKNFSYRAAFVRNEIQKKSAGSFILGGYISADVASSGVGFVPEELPVVLRDSTFDILAYTFFSSGITFGYTHTFVIKKKFFINISLVPGIGSKRLVVYDLAGNPQKIKPTATGRFTSRFAVGYEHKHYYLGLTTILTTINMNYESLEMSSSVGKVRFFIGKRFNIKSKKERQEKKKDKM